MSKSDPEKTSTRGIGRGMVIAAWVLLLVLLTVFFNDQLDRQNNPNRNLAMESGEGIPAVTLQRNRFGHYVATGAINGTPVEFMLDTGATDVSIPAGLAEQIGLQRGRASVYQTANGPITVWQTQVQEIQLGPLRLGPVRASINPHDSTGSVLLGMSFLKHLDFKQRGNTLTLSYPQPEQRAWN